MNLKLEISTGTVCLHMIFSTLYTSLSHYLNKDKVIDLFGRTFQKEGSPNVECNDRNSQKKYHAWSFKIYVIFIRFDKKLNRHVVGIPMGTDNCAPWLRIYSCFVMKWTL